MVGLSRGVDNAHDRANSPSPLRWFVPLWPKIMRRIGLGDRLIDNVEDNRLQIFFPEIPSEATRRELKSNGFRWSPSVGAWQRHRSNRATYLAKLMLANRTP